MSDGFEEYEDISTSRLPDMASVLAARMASKQSTPPAGSSQPAAPNGFDPYKMMVQRKQIDSGEPVDLPTIHWPEEDVKKLQDYCSKIGIVGYNCGKMHPMAALSLLKKHLGDSDEMCYNRY